jgi:hypothetical protein
MGEACTHIKHINNKKDMNIVFYCLKINIWDCAGDPLAAFKCPSAQIGVLWL